MAELPQTPRHLSLRLMREMELVLWGTIQEWDAADATAETPDSDPEQWEQLRRTGIWLRDAADRLARHAKLAVDRTATDLDEDPPSTNEGDAQ